MTVTKTPVRQSLSLTPSAGIPFRHHIPTSDALGDIGGKTATRLLQRALADQKKFIREAAAENLAKLSNQQD